LKYIIIKDDDISYFTNPDTLTILYGKILEKNKVNFSVIPNIYASISLDKTNIYYQKEGLLYDPLIHPKYRGEDEHYLIEKNDDLIAFLNQKNVEVLQHGYSHEKINNLPEFAVDKGDLIYQRAVNGKNILKKCLNKNIDFFIPPWNAISKEFIKRLSQEYKGIITSSLYPFYKNLNLLSLYYLNKTFKKNYYLYNNLLIIENHDLFSKYMDTKLIQKKFNQIIDNNKIIIIQNHYWEFYENWDKINDLIKPWNVVCDSIINNEDIKIINYDELFSLIISGKI